MSFQSLSIIVFELFRRLFSNDSIILFAETSQIRGALRDSDVELSNVFAKICSFI